MLGLEKLFNSVKYLQNIWLLLAEISQFTSYKKRILLLLVHLGQYKKNYLKIQQTWIQKIALRKFPIVTEMTKSQISRKTTTFTTWKQPFLFFLKECFGVKLIVIKKNWNWIFFRKFFKEWWPDSNWVCLFFNKK